MVNSQNLFCMKLDTLQCLLKYSFITFSNHYILCRTIFLKLLFVANTQYCDEFIHSKCTVWIMWTYFMSKIARSVHYNAPKRLVSIIFHLRVIRHFVTPSWIKTCWVQNRQLKWIAMTFWCQFPFIVTTKWPFTIKLSFFFLFFFSTQLFIPSTPLILERRGSSTSPI